MFLKTCFGHTSARIPIFHERQCTIRLSYSLLTVRYVLRDLRLAERCVSLRHVVETIGVFPLWGWSGFVADHPLAWSVCLRVGVLCLGLLLFSSVFRKAVAWGTVTRC